MSYCTLEEAWGPKFKKQNKSKKQKRLERVDKNVTTDSIDPQILIPETGKMADYRQPYRQPSIREDTSNIIGYDPSDRYISTYQRYPVKQVESSNEGVLASQINQTPPYGGSSLIRDVEKPIDEFVRLTTHEYNKLKNTVVEGFGNPTDGQFNQLLLFIFAGIFYLFTLDMMYQLGKRSY